MADPVMFNAGMKRLKPGDGETFVIRVEREADAKRHHQLKFLYGYCYKQVSEYTGFTMPEIDLMFRGLFLPPGVDTLSLMSYEQMADYTRAVEQYAAETIGLRIEGPNEARNWTA